MLAPIANTPDESMRMTPAGEKTETQLKPRPLAHCCVYSNMLLQLLLLLHSVSTSESKQFLKQQNSITSNLLPRHAMRRKVGNGPWGI